MVGHVRKRCPSTVGTSFERKIKNNAVEVLASDLWQFKIVAGGGGAPPCGAVDSEPSQFWISRDCRPCRECMLFFVRPLVESAKNIP